MDSDHDIYAVPGAAGTKLTAMIFLVVTLTQTALLAMKTAPSARRIRI